VYLYGYETLEDMMERLPYFSEEVYNLIILYYSALGYLAPNDFEEIVIIQ